MNNAQGLPKARWMALALICFLCLTSLPSCRSRPPALEDVYDRLVEVIDASVDVNVILFGAGLPVYERDTAEDALIHRYYGVTDNGTLMVSEYARYTTENDIEKIENAIRAVYSSAYAESLIETLFTGYASSESGSLLAARYTVNDGKLMQSADYQPLVPGVRIFDYSSMTVDPASTATYLKIRILSRVDDPSEPDTEWKTTTLTFVQQNNTWYLDSPSC